MNGPTYREEIQSMDFQQFDRDQSFFESYDDTAMLTDAISTNAFDQEPLLLESLFPYSGKDKLTPLFSSSSITSPRSDESLYDSDDTVASSSIEQFYPDQIFSTSPTTHGIVPDDIVSSLQHLKEESLLLGPEESAISKPTTSFNPSYDNSDKKKINFNGKSIEKTKKCVGVVKKQTQSNQESRSHIGKVSKKVISKNNIRKKDVLFGRGKRSNNHYGNKYFRELVLSMSLEYKNCSKVKKTALSKRIVDMIHMKGGRFLTAVPDSDSWVEVKGLALRRKASQALRDSNIYRSSAK